MPEERALGAAVIAVIIGIVGFFVLIGGIVGLFSSILGWNWTAFTTQTFLSWLTFNETIYSVIVIVLGLIFIGIALGLYRQEFWALVVMFVFGILYLVGEISGVVGKLYYTSPPPSVTDPNILGSMIGIVVVVLVLAYLAAVRDDFI